MKTERFGKGFTVQGCYVCIIRTHAGSGRRGFWEAEGWGWGALFHPPRVCFICLSQHPNRAVTVAFHARRSGCCVSGGSKLRRPVFFFFLAYNNIRSAGGVCCCVHISYIHTYYGGAFSCLFILICLICDVFLSVHVFVVCAFFMNECVSVFFSFIERVGPPLFFCGVLRCLQSSYIVMALGFSWLRVIYCGCCKSWLSFFFFLLRCWEGFLVRPLDTLQIWFWFSATVTLGFRILLLQTGICFRKNDVNWMKRNRIKRKEAFSLVATAVVHSGHTWYVFAWTPLCAR